MRALPTNILLAYRTWVALAATSPLPDRREHPRTARRLLRVRYHPARAEPTPERLITLRNWGVTDYLKPPWTAGLRPTNPPLADKLDELSRFAATYKVGSG